MTTDELRAEYAKQKEREGFAEIVNEYCRIKDLITDAGVGKLTFDEVENISLLVCRSIGTFDRDLIRGRGIGI